MCVIVVLEYCVDWKFETIVGKLFGKLELSIKWKYKLYWFLIETSINVDNCWKFSENLVKVFKMLRILPKMLKCWKMLVWKLIFSTQIILFFDKEFKKIIINPYFYQHLFSSLIICYVRVLRRRTARRTRNLTVHVCTITCGVQNHFTVNDLHLIAVYIRRLRSSGKVQVWW